MVNKHKQQWSRRVRRSLGGAATALVAALAIAPLTSAHAEEEKVLNIYHWSDYIADDTVANFEKETGIKVRYDVFDSNEILNAKLIAGRTGYDIVVPSSNWAQLQLQGGLFQKLDKSLLPNLENMDPALQEQMALIDPNNEHLVIWMWGYNTLGINVDKVKEALGDMPMPEDDWDLLFNPKYVSKLKSCGVSLLDSPTEVLQAVLHYMGKDPGSSDPADYKAASELLKTIRPSITLFSSSGYINDMANGSLCLVYGWSGDISIAKLRAKEIGNGVNIDVLVPDTGAQLFFDTMAIPADAAHPENAHKFINYIMRPEVHAEQTNAVFYANPNIKSRPFVDKEIAEDPSVFLSAEKLKKMYPPVSLSPEARRVITRTYTQFKAGM